jgi:hypothetical protein
MNHIVVSSKMEGGPADMVKSFPNKRQGAVSL